MDGPDTGQSGSLNDKNDGVAERESNFFYEVQKDVLNGKREIEELQKELKER